MVKKKEKAEQIRELCKQMKLENEAFTRRYEFAKQGRKGQSWQDCVDTLTAALIHIQMEVEGIRKDINWLQNKEEK